MKILKYVKFSLFILLFVGSLVLVIFPDLVGYSAEEMQGKLSNDPSSIIFYILWISFATSTTLPITLILASGVWVFKASYAILYGFIGILLGGFLVYFLSMWLGSDFLKDYIGLKKGKFRLLKKMIERNSFGLVIILNCVYFFPSNVAHAISGVTKLRFDKFLFAMVLGNFLNFTSIGFIMLGIIEGNTYYILFASIVILLTSVLPLYIYRKNLKELIVFAFSKQTYKRLKEIESELEGTGKKA